MNRRTVLKAMLTGGLTIGCRRGSTPCTTKRLTLTEKMELMSCIKAVETGRANEVGSIIFACTVKGDAGELGPVQIRKQYVDDVNRIVGKDKWKYKSREYMGSCRAMMLIYWDHYATIDRLGHEPTLEDLARIHNGGPNGWRKGCTKKYWVKVKAEYERLVR